MSVVGKNKRVLHLIHSVDPMKGGTSVALKSLVEGCEQVGLKSIVITLDAPDAAWLASWRTPVVATGPVYTRFGWTPRLRPTLMREAAHAVVVVVHGLWQFHNLEARKVCALLGVPCLVYPHGMLDPWALRQAWLKRLPKAMVWRLVVAPLLRMSAAVCYTCELESQEAAKAVEGLGIKSVVLPLGVEGPPDTPAILRAEFARREPGLNGRKIILQLGRLHPKKGCDLTIEGFARWLENREVGRERPHLRLTGPPESANYLAHLQGVARCHGLEIGKDISFAGMMPGRLRWQELAASAVMILPSHQENFGIVVGEALACGRPVLLSNRVNIWPWVTEADAGHVAPDTVDGVCDLLAQWSAHSPAELQAMSGRATELYRAKFSMLVQCEEFRRLIEALVPDR